MKITNKMFSRTVLYEPITGVAELSDFAVTLNIGGRRFVDEVLEGEFCCTFSIYDKDIY